MAIQVNVWDETFIAGEDLQSSQYIFVRTSGTGVTMCRTSGEQMLGPLQNAPKSGMNAVVRMVGKSKLMGADSVTIGGLLTTSHSGLGLGVTLTSGEYVGGQAAQTFSSGRISEILVRGTPVRAQ